jgi:hypothetical protein
MEQKELSGQIYSETHSPLREMALMALIQANPQTLPGGMRIEVITNEYQETGEEPHFHLFPADHVSRRGKANNYDLITKIALTEDPPKSPEDIHEIKGNSPVPKEYKEAIFTWSRENDRKLGVNNWILTRDFWDRQAASVKSCQLQ